MILSSCKTKQGTASSAAAPAVKTSSSKSGIEGKQRVDFERVFFDANKEKMLGNYDLAETLFAKALTIDPNSGAAMYELANIYAFQGNKNQALYYSKKAAASDPKNIWYQLLYAQCLKENKQLSEVVSVYEKVVKDNPDRIELYYELANAYLYVNKLNDAIKVYNRIEEQIGVTEDASMQKIKIYKSQNNFDKSVEEVQKLIKAYPKEAKYYGMLGEIYQDKGQGEKAFEAYNDLLKIDPQNAYVHLSLADYYRSLKQNDKAFEEIKIAFRSQELDIDTKVKILLSYYSITETYTELKPDADELCRILVEVHPEEAKAFSIYGDFLFRDKKLEEARTQYRKSISLDKEKYALWNQLLQIDSELNDIAALEKDSKETIELFPNQAVPYFYNGAANIQLKKYKEAIEVLNEGKEFVYDSPLILSTFYSTLGDAYNQLKRHTASDSAYDKALELDPNNVSVLNNYAYYLSLRNTNLEKAEAMSKRSNDLQPGVASYQDTYGWILYQMKKYEEAKVWIGKALDNGGRPDPNPETVKYDPQGKPMKPYLGNGTLLEHYGDVLFRLGDKDGALKYWMDAKKAGGTTDLIDKKIADKKIYE
ncbi:MAG: Tetratricopeptide repeat-containing protein [Bacteroidetes bacterium]|nr:Tetratricopeptide repeat-containing protein [Bacteroidota bacterium]